MLTPHYLVIPQKLLVMWPIILVKNMLKKNSISIRSLFLPISPAFNMFAYHLIYPELVDLLEDDQQYLLHL